MPQLISAIYLCQSTAWIFELVNNIGLNLGGTTQLYSRILHNSNIQDLSSESSPFIYIRMFLISKNKVCWASPFHTDNDAVIFTELELLFCQLQDFLCAWPKWSLPFLNRFMTKPKCAWLDLPFNQQYTFITFMLICF